VAVDADAAEAVVLIFDATRAQRGGEPRLLVVARDVALQIDVTAQFRKHAREILGEQLHVQVAFGAVHAIRGQARSPIANVRIRYAIGAAFVAHAGIARDDLATHLAIQTLEGEVPLPLGIETAAAAFDFESGAPGEGAVQLRG